MSVALSWEIPQVGDCIQCWCFCNAGLWTTVVRLSSKNFASRPMTHVAAVVSLHNSGGWGELFKFVALALPDLEELGVVRTQWNE